MSTTPVTEWIATTSPRFQARMAGVVAWITTTSAFAAIVRGRLIVFDDAAATAHNILSHQLLFRLAFAADVIAILYIVYTLLLYNLFRAVNRNLSLLAVFFSLVGCAIGTLNCLFHLVPLVILGGAATFSAFNPQQLQALALLFLKLHAQGYNISMVLFGFYNLLIGYLIFRSTFLPRILGVLLASSGVCYIVNCFSNFISPTFAAHLLPYILIPGVSELLLALWFVVMGVNEHRWKMQAVITGEARF